MKLATLAGNPAGIKLRYKGMMSIQMYLLLSILQNHHAPIPLS